VPADARVPVQPLTPRSTETVGSSGSVGRVPPDAPRSRDATHLPAAYSRVMKKRAPSRDRKIVPIAEAAERRRKKVVRQALRDVADATEALAGDPDAASNFTMLGNMALIQLAFDEAIEPFSRALRLAPDDVNALAGRARAYAALGEHALALADFDRAAAAAPDKPMHHIGRANALAKMGRLKEAIDAASRAIEAAPDHAGAHYTRAVYRSHVAPDDPGVRADLDRTVELAPREVPYLVAHAEYLLELGEHDLALADVDRALALVPGEAKLHYLRGRCLSEACPV
jgi:tetratricopeptide (TPR) repeat protein